MSSPQSYFVLFGVTTGVVHHLLLQYPRQAPLFTTMFFFLCANFTFTIALWFRLTSELLDALTGLGKPLVVFYSAYVNSTGIQLIFIDRNSTISEDSL